MSLAIKTWANDHHGHVIIADEQYRLEDGEYLQVLSRELIVPRGLRTQHLVFHIKFSPPLRSGGVTGEINR